MLPQRTWIFSFKSFIVSKYRDLIESVKTCAGRQKATQLDGEDRDIIAMARGVEDAVIQVFFIRGGKMNGREHFFINVRVDDADDDLMDDVNEKSRKDSDDDDDDSEQEKKDFIISNRVTLVNVF